jgi:hypothetical protein
MGHRETDSITPLPNGTTLALRAGDRGAIMLCRSGTCWVTEEGVFEDHVLRNGDAYRPQRNGLVVICALSDAEMELRGTVRRAEVV